MLQQNNQSKAEKDHQIKILQEEIDGQDNIINRLNKEKKQLLDSNQRTAEELQIAEDKNHHLTKIKAKLESTLDDIEDALEREKKSRLEQERHKRKAEAEVKSMQTALDALERQRKEGETSISRKDKEINALNEKLSQEQVNLSKANKQIKECGVSVKSFT